MLPYVYEAQFVQGVACFPDDNNTVLIQARHTLTAIWFTFGGLTPMAVNIAVPIICLCYIKKNTVTEDIQYQKGLSKFSLFLMLGGASNMVGQLIPGLVAYYKAAPGLYIAYGFASISLLPTPIIIIAYLKPVQEQLKKMFTVVSQLQEQKTQHGQQALLAALQAARWLMSDTSEFRTTK